MATTAAQDKINKPLLFTTSDHRGNEVICSSSTWNKHTASHPEIIGREEEAKAILSDPDAVYPSTVSPKALIFQSTTSSDELKVVVAYDDIGLYEQGGTTAKVLSVHPYDNIRYDKPNVDYGNPRYVRPTPDSGGKGESGDD